MRRYFISSKEIQQDLVHLHGDLFHHIFDVCRLRPGQHFELLTEKGEAFLVVVETVQKKAAQVKVVERRAIAPLRKPYIHLVMSIPKIATFEAVLEKAVELGVSSIQPVFSDYSFFRSTSSFPVQKMDRWNKIVLSATQQSGRGDLMPIHSAQTLSAFLSSFNLNEQKLGLFAYEGDTTLGIKAHLAHVKSRNISNIWVFVGSEGGFSETEVQNFHSLGLSPITLGEQILRVETACVTLVSALKYEFDLLS